MTSASGSVAQAGAAASDAWFADALSGVDGTGDPWIAAPVDIVFADPAADVASVEQYERFEGREQHGPGAGSRRSARAASPARAGDQQAGWALQARAEAERQAQLAAEQALQADQAIRLAEERAERERAAAEDARRQALLQATAAERAAHAQTRARASGSQWASQQGSQRTSQPVQMPGGHQVQLPGWLPQQVQNAVRQGMSQGTAQTYSVSAMQQYSGSTQSVPLPAAPAPAGRTQNTARQPVKHHKRSSGITVLVIFLIILFASGLGGQLIDALMELINR